MYNESFEFFLTFRIFWISVVLSQSVRGSIHETITAIAGMESGLPCNLTSPTPDDDIALVLWYKDDSTTPIYSLDSRRSPVKVAKHVAADEYASRAYLETLQSPSLLKLAPVLKEDEGDYKCRADFKNARTRYSSVTLRVIVPPKTPVISDESGEILQSLIGPYNEGDRLKLICETTGGDPSPSLTWWRESVLLDESYRHSPQQGITRNELDIRVLQRHDLMAVFSCRAKNNVITAPITSTVTVDLNFRPLDVKQDYDGHPLSAMKPIELVCRTTGSRPPATVTWYKGKAKLKSAKDAISADGNTTTSVLHYVPSSDDHAEKLICKAENLLIPGSQIEDAVALDIYYIPKVSLRLGNKLRHKHIQEGNDVYFECSVQANPFIGYVEWLFEGQELVTNTTGGIILSNQSLVLQNVLRDKRGRYVCKGRNSEGEGTSNTVTLRVQYSPFCKSEQKIRYGAAMGETIAVSCEVEADPAAVKFYWLFNRTTPPLDSISFASEGTKSVASYHVANEENYGSLYCWASNNVGTQSQPCQFVIFQAGPPDPVFNCSVTNQTNTCFTVECLHNTVNEAVISLYYLMELYDNHWKQLYLNESSGTPSFRACKLPPGSRFIVVLFAVNTKGRSESVTIHTGTQAPYESFAQTNEQWKAIFSPTLLVLMSVIAVLVAIAVIFVVMIKVKENYIRKKAAKAHTEDKKMEKLLHKEQGGICKSVSIGLDEKCPDIISGPVYASV